MPVPESVAIPEHAHDILTDLPTGHLATLRPDGRISVNPVALVFDGSHVRVSTLKSRFKYRNLLRDDRISISVPHRNNPNRYVEIRGRAILEDDPDRAFVNEIARIYMGADEYPFDQPGDERVTITIVAEQVSAPKIPLASDPPGAPDAS
ncbi:PPOX class F420-dependent oxidoreductase [Myxococcota bacterium]|nr:PPOX class F420-dependent oxidoreductase [Myxococcota bacterium]